MFTTLPKSRVAKEKASLLSPLELAHLDMCLTAAFARPDSYIRIVDHFIAEQQGSAFDFYVIELTELAFVLVVSKTGRMAITDFWLYAYLGIQPVQPDA